MTRNPALPPAPPGDDLDGLLRAFFQAQLPASWPAPPNPVPSQRAFQARRSQRALLRSRLALAASLLLLIAGSLWLAGRPLSSAPAGDSTPVLVGPSASRQDQVHRHTGKSTSSGRHHRQAPAEGPEPIKPIVPMDMSGMK